MPSWSIGRKQRRPLVRERAMAGHGFAVGPEPDRGLVVDVTPLPAVPDVARVGRGPRADWFAQG